MTTPRFDAAAGPIRVLLVDDDRDDYVLTRDLFADIPGEPFLLDWESDYDSGIEAICTGVHDVCLIDYRLGSRTGLDLLADARRRGCTRPVILLTGQSHLEIDLAAMAGGAADYLEKSRLDSTTLERSIRYTLLQARHEAELERKVRERTEELGRANQALQDADRAKDEFLATLAHELRNPLAPISYALETMKITAADPAAVGKARGRIERQVRHMVRLINDLLDVSRITRGKLALDTADLDLREVLEAAGEAVHAQFEKAGVAYAADLPEKSLDVTGDRDRLAQLFGNLLNNAAKYTNAGGTVTLTAGREGAHVVVRVVDTGVGIPADAIDKVFDLFTQVDRNLNRSQGGLGIGLSLVKRIAELHGGTVSAHSDGDGSGATFVVSLPGGDCGCDE